jgi:hypothetical protein
VLYVGDVKTESATSMALGVRYGAVRIFCGVVVELSWVSDGVAAGELGADQDAVWMFSLSSARKVDTVRCTSPRSLPVGSMTQWGGARRSGRLLVATAIVDSVGGSAVCTADRCEDWSKDEGRCGGHSLSFVKYADRPCIGCARPAGDGYETMSFREVGARALNIASALQQRGPPALHSIAICSANRLEWLLADFGASDSVAAVACPVER